MKRVLPGGYVTYRVVRQIHGKPYLFVLHLSPTEVSTGRDYVARRLRSWRAGIIHTIERETSCTKH